MIIFNLTHVSDTSSIIIKDSEILIQLALLRSCDKNHNKKYTDKLLHDFIMYILKNIHLYTSVNYSVKYKIKEALNHSTVDNISYLMEYFKITIKLDEVLMANKYFITQCKKCGIDIL